MTTESEQQEAHYIECPRYDETTRRGRTCICKAIGAYSLVRRMAQDWSKP